jgi:hypothetical protein
VSLPGYIDTLMYLAAALSEEESTAVTGRIVAGRFGRPEEAAATVAFLTSSDASYTNGQHLVIDGGLVGPYQPDQPSTRPRTNLVNEPCEPRYPRRTPRGPLIRWDSTLRYDETPGQGE